VSIHPLLTVDAFTTRPLGGNPCAVVFDADSLSAETMLAIAGEMNLSETAFVLRSSLADFRARYFTPRVEIPLAGHPTIATVHALVDTGRLRLGEERTAISLELRDGPIAVEVLAGGGRVEQIVMTQPKPAFLRVHDPAQVLPALSLGPADALPGVPLQTVSTGTPQLMVPLRDHAALRRARIDGPLYERLVEQGDFMSAHLFSLGGATPEGRTFARHLGAPGVSEDPATGSATGGMAAYLWHHGLVDSPVFTAEQGHWMGRPSTIRVEVVGAPAAIEAVRVGGTAVTVLRGELDL
jgi:trans-2,3-dihydro-3-hydroxyanthranilate isomerase